MEAIPFRPVYISSTAAVLLVFVPGLTSQNGIRNGQATQRLEVDFLLERIRNVFGGQIRVTLVDETLHPEIVRSFGIQKFPSFILIKQGAEIWRYAGLPENGVFLQQLTEQMGRL